MSTLLHPLRTLKAPHSINWVPALIATAFLSVLVNLIVVRAIGADIIEGRLSASVKSQAGESATLAGLYVDRPFWAVAGLFAISVLVWLTLRSPLGSTGTKIEGRFGLVFSICAYSAYLRQAVRLIVVLVGVGWHRLNAVPLDSLRDFKTDAAAVLAITPGEWTFPWARSLDFIMAGFAVCVAVAIWKAVPDFNFVRSLIVVLAAWALYICLGVFLGIPW